MKKDDITIIFWPDGAITLLDETHVTTIEDLVNNGVELMIKE